MQEKVSFEVASAEVSKWLDARFVTPRKRERVAEAIEILTEAMMYGRLAFDHDTMVITQTLNYPIKDSEGGIAISTLDYKPRLSVVELQNKSKADKDGDSRLASVAAALTGQPGAIIGKLDTVDNSVSQAIGVFFL